LQKGQRIAYRHILGLSSVVPLYMGESILARARSKSKRESALLQSFKTIREFFKEIVVWLEIKLRFFLPSP